MMVSVRALMMMLPVFKGWQGEQSPSCDCRAANVNANPDMVFRHNTRKTVHYGHMNDDAVLACGRPLSENYVQIVVDPGDLWPKCKDCF